MKKNLTLLTLPAILLALGMLHSTALGQFEMLSAMSMSGDEGVATAGQAELLKKPTMLRLHVEITAKGKTLEDALENLEKQIEETKKKIEKLGPIKESIEVGTPQPTASNAQYQKQMEMMIRSQMAGMGRKPPAGLKKILMVAAKASFKADWKLDAETPAEQLLFIDELKKGIEEADISGQKENEKLSPEEEEMMAEIQSNMGRNFGSDNEIAPGTPIFVFIATITPEESQKLLKDAYQNAREEANKLTDAVGIPLGKLISLSGTISKNQEGLGMHSYGGYEYEMREYMQAMGIQSSVAKNEAISRDCGPIKFGAYVKTVYELE